MSTTQSPFDDPGADVILRSCDNVDFRVYKLLLSLASPVFKSMFTLPQPSVLPSDSSDANPEEKDGLPVIQLAEAKLTLQNLLTYCYPKWTADPPMDTLAKITAVLEAAAKYDMDEVRLCAGRRLTAEQFLEKEPLRVYAIACRFRLEREATLAAKRTISKPVLGQPFIDDLEHISAAALYRVQEYHFKCVSAARTEASKYDWCRSTMVSLLGCPRGCIKGDYVRMSGSDYAVPAWWMHYTREAIAALANQPCSASVTNLNLMEEAIRKAKDCPACNPKARQELMNCSLALAAVVDKAVSGVWCQTMDPATAC